MKRNGNERQWNIRTICVENGFYVWFCRNCNNGKYCLFHGRKRKPAWFAWFVTDAVCHQSSVAAFSFDSTSSTQIHSMINERSIVFVWRSKSESFSSAFLSQNLCPTAHVQCIVNWKMESTSFMFCKQIKVCAKQIKFVFQWNFRSHERHGPFCRWNLALNATNASWIYNKIATFALWIIITIFCCCCH